MHSVRRTAVSRLPCKFSAIIFVSSCAAPPSPFRTLSASNPPRSAFFSLPDFPSAPVPRAVTFRDVRVVPYPSAIVIQTVCDVGRYKVILQHFTCNGTVFSHSLRNFCPGSKTRAFCRRWLQELAAPQKALLRVQAAKAILLLHRLIPAHNYVNCVWALVPSPKGWCMCLAAHCTSARVLIAVSGTRHASLCHTCLTAPLWSKQLPVTGYLTHRPCAHPPCYLTRSSSVFSMLVNEWSIQPSARPGSSIVKFYVTFKFKRCQIAGHAPYFYFAAYPPLTLLLPAAPRMLRLQRRFSRTSAVAWPLHLS